MIGNGACPADGRPTDGRPRGASGASWSLRDHYAMRDAPFKRHCFGGGSGLEERANVLAVDAKADNARGAVDLVDRVGRDEAAAAREEAGLHREGIRNVRSRAVHGALDLPDQAALAVGDDVPGRAAEVDGDGTHVGDGIPALRPIS